MNSVPASVATLGHTVSALRGLPVPALPPGLAGGGVALVAKAGSTGTASATGAKVGAIASKLAAGKATVVGVVTAHLAPVVAGTAALAVGVTGVAVGASRCLPGDPLYGLKRATEAVRTATTTTRVSAAERQLDLATTRLHEALALQARGGSAEHITTEVHEWMADVSSAITVLGPLAGTPVIRAKLAAFAAANGKGLTEFPAAAVAPATAAVARITTLITGTATPATAPWTATIPTPLAKPAATAKTRPAAPPSIAREPRPAAHAPGVADRPTVTPSVAVKLPKVSTVPTAPAVVIPSAALPSVLPTALPSALPSIPVPTVSDLTTVLQGLPPQH